MDPNNLSIELQQTKLPDPPNNNLLTSQANNRNSNITNMNLSYYQQPYNPPMVIRASDYYQNQYPLFVPPQFNYMNNSSFGMVPAQQIIVPDQQGYYCKACQRSTLDSHKKKVGNLIRLLGVALAITIPILMWIPYCIDQCKDIQISCRNCGMVKKVKTANCC